MSAAGIVAGVGAVVLGGAALFGWSTTREPASASAPSGSAVALDGASLFVAKGCATCHDGPDSQSFMDGFPNLSDVASFASTREPGVSAEEYVAESIEDPGAFISPAFHGGVGPTTSMPGLDVTPAEVDALVAYLLE